MADTLSRNANLELLAWINRELQLDENAIEALFGFLRPPSDLRCLGRVTQNVLALRPLVEAYRPDVSALPEIKALFSLCASLGSSPELIARLEGKRSQSTNPMYGLTSQHIVYSMLVATPASHREPAFRRLQAWAFSCARLTFDSTVQVSPEDPRPWAAPWKGGYDRLIKTEKVLRDIALAGREDTLTEHCSFSDQTLEDLADSLEALKPVLSDSGTRESAEKIALLVGAARGTKKIFSRPLGAGAGRTISRTNKAPKKGAVNEASASIEREVIEHVSDINDEQILSFSTKALDTDDAETGLAYDDGRVRPKLVRIADRVNARKGDSPRMAAMRNQAILKAIAMRRQSLPYELARFSLYEIRTLHHHLRLLAEGKSDFKTTSADPLAIAALVTLSFWTGVSPSIAATTVLIENAEVHGYPGDQIPYFDRDSQTWCPPRLPLNKPAAPKEPAWVGKFVEAVAPRVVVKFPAAPMTLVQPWLEIVRGQASTLRYGALLWSLFPDDRAALLEATSSFLSWINRRTLQTRLTAHRVGMHTYHAIEEQTSDSADATLLTGRCSLGAEIALFYYAPRIQYLREAYRKVTDALSKELIELSGHEFAVEQPPLPQDDPARIGSAICPRTEYLQGVTAALIKRVELAARQLESDPSLAHWIAFHNLYVSYIVLFLGYCTGYRDVSHPFPTIDRFDPQSEFLVISDKDYDGAPLARIVWLPPEFRKQLAQYATHLQRLGETFILLGASWATSLSAPTPGQLGKYLSGQVQPVEPKSTATASRLRPPLFFFVTAGGEGWERVSRASIGARIGDIYPIPINANRHFLRTHLREAGVSGEIVDAFMGHAGIGQEPFGRFSSITAAELRDGTRRVLMELLQQCGWRAIPPRLQKHPKTRILEH